MGETGQALEYPVAADIVAINREQIAHFGGYWLPPDNLRQPGGLDSLLESIQYPIFGVDLYPGLVRKAAHLAYTIICGHLFWDGCKRTGMHAMLYLCVLNGYTLRTSTDEFETVAVSMASRVMTEPYLTTWARRRLSIRGR